MIVSVQDTGRGIKAELINKLFDKFERLDVEKNTTAEGTGLGLAITKSLVNMMGVDWNGMPKKEHGSAPVMVPALAVVGNCWIIPHKWIWERKSS